MDAREESLDCPYCGARVTMLVDPSVAEQRYIEDCEVCCNPIEVTVVVRDGEVAWIDARSIEQ
jgi:hypothetical protein